MTRVRRRLYPATSIVGVCLVAGTGLLAGLAAVSVPAAAADYSSVHEVAIVATVRPDGSMAVTETRTFHFSGDLHWFEQCIAIERCDDIIDVTVREGPWRFREVTGTDAGEVPGAFSVVKTADRVTIRVGFVANAGDKIFTTEYLVLNPVVVHNDVAELYWKFVGPGWSIESRKVTVDINLPAEATSDEVKVWLHAPLPVAIEKVSPTLIRAGVTDVPSETFVEARVTFPVGLVPSAGNRSGRDGLPGILAEEGRWARAANLEWEARRKARRLEVYSASALLLAVVALGWWLMARWGFERRPARKPDYFRELPGDYSPAELGALWHFGHPTAADFVATILDLARRGWILIEEVRREEATFRGFRSPIDRSYRVWERATPPVDDRLKPHEDTVLQFLLRCRVAGSLSATPPEGMVGPPVTFSDIEDHIKRNPKLFGDIYGLWRKLSKVQADARGFFDLESEWAQSISAVWGKALKRLGREVVHARALIGGAAVFLGGVGLDGLTFFVSRRSQGGCDQYWLWRGFRNYLTGFSRLHEAAPPALALWDHYLVYAVSLGVAKEVIRQLPIVYKDIAPGQGFGDGWFIATGANHGTSAGLESLGGGFAHGMESLTSFLSALTTSLQGAVSAAMATERAPE